MKTKKKREMGHRILSIRQKLGLTQKEFASRFNPPASKGAVSRWESGDRTPSDRTLQKIAKMGDVSVNYLRTGFSLNYVDYKNLLDKAMNNDVLSNEERQRLAESQIDFFDTISVIKNKYETDAHNQISKQQTIIKDNPLSAIDLFSYSDILGLFNLIRLHGSEKQRQEFRTFLNTLRLIADGTIEYHKNDTLHDIDKFLSSLPVKKKNN